MGKQYFSLFLIQLKKRKCIVVSLVSWVSGRVSTLDEISPSDSQAYTGVITSNTGALESRAVQFSSSVILEGR